MKKFLPLFFLGSFFLNEATYAQNISYQIDIDNLYYSEPGCGDQSSTPDPRWRVRVLTNGSTYNFNADRDDISGCGWQGISNLSLTPTINSTLPNNIVVQFDGWEDDGIWADDADCKGYAQIGSVANICDYEPYQWHYFTNTRFCNSDGTTGEYRVQWSYYWSYNEAPTITSQPVADSDLCLGTPRTLSVAVNNDNCGRSMGRYYQWQVSTNTACGGATGWTNIAGANSATYTVPQTPGTRLYRCLITSNGSASFTTNTVTSACARVTYNPINPAPPIQSGICGNTVLPGTSHLLNTLQPPAVGAVVNLSGYSWSATGGSFSSASGSSTTWTAPNTPGTYYITVTYVDVCGNVLSPVCTVDVGAPACDFVYVAPSGTNDINCGGPNNPCQTLTGPNGALAKVSGSRNYIKMASGNYNEPQIVVLTNDITIDGGYIFWGPNWVKHSAPATPTTLIINGIESVSGVRHRMGIKANGVNNWKLMDLHIYTNNLPTTERDASGRGASNYGVWVNNCTGYEISRCVINSGNAGSGADGANGAAGHNGATGVAGNSHSDANSTNTIAGGVAPAGNSNAWTGSNGGKGGNGGSTCGNTCGNGGGVGTAGQNSGGNGGNGGAGINPSGCGPDNGNNGSAGGGYVNTTINTPGINGGTMTPNHVFNIYFNPSTQALQGGHGRAGGGGGGGGASSGEDGGFISGCIANSGNGGGSGGQGGGGGQGGFGGMGGGSSFAVYVSGTYIAPTQTTLGYGSAGNGGIGGQGGNGGYGGAGGNGPNNHSSNRGNAGDGGSGGSGAKGGSGQNGANGISAQMVVNGVISSPSVLIPTTPSLYVNTENAKICQNSVVEIMKGAGTNIIIPSGFYFVRYNSASTPSEFTSSSNPVDVYTTNTSGTYDLGIDAQVFPNYLPVRGARTLPVITVRANDGTTLTPAGTICDGGTVQLSATSWGTQVEYKWEIFPGTVALGKLEIGFPLFSSTLQSPVTSPLSAGTYTVRYQVREECCGWSIPVFATITVNPDPTAPLAFVVSPSDTVCVPLPITANSPSGVSGGIPPYSYEWDYDNTNHAYGTYSTTQPNFASALGQNKVMVRVAENALKGCDASAGAERIVIGVEQSTAPSSISGTNLSCAGDSVTLSVNGGVAGHNGIAEWFTGSCGGTPIGTGNSILVQPTVTTTYYVRYNSKCNTTSCVAYTVTVNPLPNAFTPAIATALPLCLGSSAQISVNPSQVGVNYQLYNGITPVGSAVAGNGAAIEFSTGNLNTTALAGVYHVVAQNASACTLQATLSSPITVSLTPTALANNGDSRTCYVNGNNAFVEFTLGNRGIASLNPGSQNLGYVTITEYVEASPVNIQACNTSPTNQPQFTSAALNRHWLITSTIAPTAPSDIRLYINGADVTALAAVANINANPNDDVSGLSSLELSKYTGPNENNLWPDNCNTGGVTTLHTASASGLANGAIVGGSGIISGSYLRYSIPSFSELWLAGTNNVSPLPIVLGAFDLHCADKKTEIEWTTLSEINNAYFQIQRSINGIEWENIAEIPGSGNSNMPLQYSYSDASAPRGMVYYRLKQVDYNGAFEIFGAKSIACISDGENSVVIYPNPTRESFTIEFHLDKNYSEAHIELIDMTGRVVGQKNLELTEGFNSYTYSPLPVSGGVYTVRIKAQGEVLLQSPIVIHKH